MWREQDTELRTARKGHTMEDDGRRKDKRRREQGVRYDREEGNLERGNERKDGFGFTCASRQERKHRI